MGDNIAELVKYIACNWQTYITLVMQIARTQSLEYMEEK